MVRPVINPGFYPETALFRNLGVNLRVCLFGVESYASAQRLDFLDLAKNYSFPNQKPIGIHPKFPDEYYSNNFFQ